MMTQWLRRLALVLTLAVAALDAQGADVVRVGSKIDTEGALLGAMIAQVLDANGIKTQSELSLGATEVVRQAIRSGQIDIYPEYTGNGAFFFAEEKDPVWRDAKQGYERVKALDMQRNQLVWLPCAPADNSWGIAVRRDLAQAHGLRTLADLATWLKTGGKFKLAASAEFIERADALPAFESAYGFTLTQDQLLALAGGDTAVTIRAAAQGTSGVNAAMAYGTDGPVDALGLVLLSDPKHVQAVYAPAPLVRADTLREHPGIAAALAPVFRSLDTATLRKLNARVEIGGEDPKRVAAAYLKSKGFVK